MCFDETSYGRKVTQRRSRREQHEDTVQDIPNLCAFEYFDICRIIKPPNDVPWPHDVCTDEKSYGENLLEWAQFLETPNICACKLMFSNMFWYIQDQETTEICSTSTRPGHPASQRDARTDETSHGENSVRIRSLISRRFIVHSVEEMCILCGCENLRVLIYSEPRNSRRMLHFYTTPSFGCTEECTNWRGVTWREFDRKRTLISRSLVVHSVTEMFLLCGCENVRFDIFRIKKKPKDAPRLHDPVIRLYRGVYALTRHGENSFE